MISVRFIVITTMLTITNFLLGLWFLIRHPNKFVMFVDEWRKFADRIQEQDEIDSSGYYQLPRNVRRSRVRKVRKQMDA